MPIEMLQKPTSGRIYQNQRIARMGDVNGTERLRFDAAAGYLQDLAADDSADSGLTDPNSWVVKWYVMEIAAHCGFGELLDMATWASGAGGRWAERRSNISLATSGETLVEAAALWVYMDIESGRPKKLHDDFHQIYGEAAGGRKPPTKLGQSTTVPQHATSGIWHPRASDMDILGHVNNAAYFHIIEQVIAGWPPTPIRVEMEYRTPIQGFAPVQLHTVAVNVKTDAITPTGLDVWVTSDAELHLTARISPLTEMPSPPE